MLILSNVANLYDGTSAGPEAIQAGVDVFVDGPQIDAERMNRIFSAAHRLSRDLITGQKPTMVGLAPHIENVDWLADTIAATGCVESFSSPQTVSAPPRTTSKATPPRTKGSNPMSLDIGLILAGLGGVALIALIIAFRKTRTYRIMQADRLPRHLTTISVKLSYETPMRGPQSIEVTGLDVSAGGMKLAWPEAPPRGTHLTMTLPVGERTASEVWSNAHYAGVVFDHQLEPDELDLLVG